MLGTKHSLVSAPKRTQIGLSYDALPVEVQITSGRIAVRMFSAKDAGQGIMLQKCAMYPSKQVGATPFCIYCDSIDHISNRCHSKPNNNREEPRLTPRDLREQWTK